MKKDCREEQDFLIGEQEDRTAGRCDMTGRSRGTRRKTSVRKALHRKRIDSERPAFRHAERSGLITEHPWYPDLHRYSKGKIHCSCPLCRPSGGMKPSDGRRADAMKSRMKEFSC